ncbi:MAG TPA: GNAT family N-acetyltransferase [Coriobacteriia bacterium]
MGEVWEIRLVEHPSPVLAGAVELRYRVLHQPFGVARDDDWNDGDPASSHLVATVGDDVIGYARLIAEPEGRTGQIRQVAVSPAWERRGVGSALIEAALVKAVELGMTDVWLNARLTAVPFYQKLGFRVTSGVFRTPRTYLPHVRMDSAL